MKINIGNNNYVISKTGGVLIIILPKRKFSGDSDLLRKMFLQMKYLFNDRKKYFGEKF